MNTLFGKLYKKFSKVILTIHNFALHIDFIILKQNLSVAVIHPSSHHPSIQLILNTLCVSSTVWEMLRNKKVNRLNIHWIIQEYNYPVNVYFVLFGTLSKIVQLLGKSHYQQQLLRFCFSLYFTAWHYIKYK